MVHKVSIEIMEKHDSEKEQKKARRKQKGKQRNGQILLKYDDCMQETLNGIK